MSKAIKWQIPFKSNSGTQYRIDIYAEGYSGQPIQLSGGPNPIVTEETKGDNYFEPVRSQTGTIQICTALPNGGMVSIDDIMPASNIDHPVILWKIGTSSNSVEWQGFLSSNAYSQDYTSIPNILQLSIISVLEALDSVELPTTATGLREIRAHISTALTEIDNKTGMSASFLNIYYSQTDWRIFEKYLDSTALFEMNEQNSEINTYYSVTGISCKEALSRICTYMGWTVREQGKDVFFQRISEEIGMYKQTMTIFKNASDQDFEDSNNRDEETVSPMNISSLVWMGTNHKRDCRQGAKSVEVVAKLDKYELEIGLPDFPTNDMIHDTNTYFESYAQMNHEFNNMLTFNYCQALVRETSGGFDLYQTGDADVEDAYHDCTLYGSCDRSAQYPRLLPNTLYTVEKNIGAFFAKLKPTGSTEDFFDGLYITALNKIEETTDNAPSVFKISSIASYMFRDGSLSFTIKAYTIASDGTTLLPFMGKAYIVLKFGSKYYNGSSWSSSTSTVWKLDFADLGEDDEPGERTISIPINSRMTGEVSISILGAITGGTTTASYTQPFYDLFIYGLELKYEEPEYLLESDRDANHYYQLLGTNFRDEVSINTEIASDMNNRLSPTLITYQNGTTMMKQLLYTTTGGVTEYRRPEKDLLARLASYYGAARQTLSLEVEHPIYAPLALLKLRGISPDTRKYLPLSESRDWKEEVCTLTCYETPE